MPRLPKEKTITLYDKAELYYQDVELKAGIIVMNYETNEVYAGRIRLPQENIHNIPISSRVQMKCSQILFDLILRHKSFNMDSDLIKVNLK
jgi:hypothetical protein